MVEPDDSFINDYLAESREHLADIETDLLAVEAGGKNSDEQLVNKVFRAAHSIKGGAGFFNLSKIQDLAHRTENVLDLIRSHEMEPSPDVINILLLAFDRLRELINNHAESQNSDNSELLVSLQGLVSAHLSPSKKSSLANTLKLTAPGVKIVFTITEFDYNRAIANNHFLYLVEYDLIDDVQRRGKRPLDVLFILGGTGALVDSAFELEAAGTLDDEPSNRLPFYVLFSTELGPENSDIIFDVPPAQIHLLHAPQVGQPVQNEIKDQKQIEKQIEKQTQKPPEKSFVAQVESPARTPVPAEIHPASAPAGGESAAPSSGQETTLRVEVGLLESLMNLAGELVLSRNQLLEAIMAHDQRSIQASSQRINLVTSELQTTIMLTRMQPIGNVFNKFPRVVRDLSRDLGKEIHLEITGREVEMDKTIIEGLSEPLTHMVRNAADHGIESPEERVKLGKLPAGTLKLKAYHEAGQVVVEIGDDGKGIDPHKVAASALERGLITQEQLKGMSLKEMTALIFLPGLSTAEKVSGVSGRGVGMDVVKTNLNRLGGKMEIETEIDHGTNFIIKLPLTLAIIPSLLVSIGNERFAIPQVHVSELIHIAADQIKKRIEVVGDADVLLLRGALIPLVLLNDVLGIPRLVSLDENDDLLPDRRNRIADRRSPRVAVDQPSSPPNQALVNKRLSLTDRRYHAGSDLNIVIITTGSLKYGLIVDNLHDTVEIVVKPLGRHLKGLREYAGATVLGDGNVAIILDAAGIASRKALVSMAGSQRAKELSEETRREEMQDHHAFLTFRNLPGEYCAVPLDLVSRVLQVSNDQLETVGGRRSMQYSGSSLPLVTLKDAAQVGALLPGQDKTVIIFNIFGHEVGLLAGMPVDVVESQAHIDQETLRQKGVLGSAILDSRTTMIVDIYELVDTVHPEWGVERERTALPANGTEKVILLAEDSDFFRNQVKHYLESDGHIVLAAMDGQEAWEMLQANAARVHLVLTDIEMPRMDGLGLTRSIRADDRFSGLPIIALTSLASEEDTVRGLAAGVNEYQVKLDREKLIEGIHRLLQKTGMKV